MREKQQQQRTAPKIDNLGFVLQEFDARINSFSIKIHSTVIFFVELLFAEIVQKCQSFDLFFFFPLNFQEK